jgi:D-alanyl-lipoteichoic acid acyltransferase DltB (MBOAT superfamily)
MVAYGLALPRLYGLPEARRRKTFLVISMVANLGILGFFKYCDFFLRSLHDLLTTIGLASTASSPVLGILLPAGISFYTFQAMSYTIDIYRGDAEPTQDFGDFALFVCFFPHLVAGPIMRAHTLVPQVVRPRARRPGDAAEGTLLVLVGLFKKIVISDNMAPIANWVFLRLASGETRDLSGFEVLVGIYAFAFQIYGDFSGYSAIARGISKWLGFDLVINFRLPYLAVSPSDFWRRWHISLSSWLRDYLYIPLGGSRGGVRKEYRNLMITMLLGGLWHGASWTFVAWGLYHGAILCAFRLGGVRDPRPADGARWLVRVIAMFHLTCLGWLLFRADSFTAVVRALTLVATRFHPTMAAGTALALLAFYSGILFAIELAIVGEERLTRWLAAPWAVQGAGYAYLSLMLLLFHAPRAYEFIYFQF